MKLQLNMFGEIESQHLPPVDQSLLLKIAHDGRVRPIEMWDTPVDDNGIPLPLKYIELLASTLHEEYVPPPEKNVHHLVSERAQYAQYGRDSIQNRFRECTSLMVEIQMQIHQYGHRVLHPIRMPRYEVMDQYVFEDEQVESLFKLGRAIIMIERWQEDVRIEDIQSALVALGFDEDFRPTEAMFFDALDTAKDGQLGLMPDRQELADRGIAEATKHLGVLAGARALTLPRKTLETIKSTPI